MNIQGYSKH